MVQNTKDTVRTRVIAPHNPIFRTRLLRNREGGFQNAGKSGGGSGKDASVRLFGRRPQSLCCGAVGFENRSRMFAMTRILVVTVVDIRQFVQLRPVSRNTMVDQNGL